MIHELKPWEFQRCLPIVNPEGHLEAKAVIARINPGRIFVDNPSSPRSALLWPGNLDGFCFLGEANNPAFEKDLAVFVDGSIAPEARELELGWFEGFGNHPGWDTTIRNIFRERDLTPWRQHVYTLLEANYKSAGEPGLEQGFRLNRITAGTFCQNYCNLIFLEEKILQFWPAVEDFLRHGIGYFIAHGDEIAGSCFSGFVFEQTHGIDIEILEAYRGRKLAQSAAHAFVKECLRKGWTAYWDCMVSNRPSNRVAQKIGFTGLFGYTGFAFRL